MDNNDKLCEISADTVTLEVTDARTGQTLQRVLPIDYFENSHGIRLRGEGLDGKPAELVFFSNAGLGKLRDLCGGGPDKDPCGGHS